MRNILNLIMIIAMFFTIKLTPAQQKSNALDIDKYNAFLYAQPNIKQQLEALGWNTNRKNEDNINNKTIPLVNRQRAVQVYIEKLRSFKIPIEKPKLKGVITYDSRSATQAQNELSKTVSKIASEMFELLKRQESPLDSTAAAGAMSRVGEGALAASTAQHFIAAPSNSSAKASSGSSSAPQPCPIPLEINGILKKIGDKIAVTLKESRCNETLAYLLDVGQFNAKKDHQYTSADIEDFAKNLGGKIFSTNCSTIDYNILFMIARAVPLAFQFNLYSSSMATKHLIEFINEKAKLDEKQKVFLCNGKKVVINSQELIQYIKTAINSPALFAHDSDFCRSIPSADANNASSAAQGSSSSSASAPKDFQKPAPKLPATAVEPRAPYPYNASSFKFRSRPMSWEEYLNLQPPSAPIKDVQKKAFEEASHPFSASFSAAQSTASIHSAGTATLTGAPGNSFSSASATEAYNAVAIPKLADASAQASSSGSAYGAVQAYAQAQTPSSARSTPGSQKSIYHAIPTSRSTRSGNWSISSDEGVNPIREDEDSFELVKSIAQRISNKMLAVIKDRPVDENYDLSLFFTTDPIFSKLYRNEWAFSSTVLNNINTAVIGHDRPGQSERFKVFIDVAASLHRNKESKEALKDKEALKSFIGNEASEADEEALKKYVDDAFSSSKQNSIKRPIDPKDQKVAADTATAAQSAAGTDADSESVAEPAQKKHRAE